MITVKQLREQLAQYPDDLEVRLFTFSKGPEGWWHDHPVEAGDTEWTHSFLRLVAES